MKNKWGTKIISCLVFSMIILTTSGCAKTHDLYDFYTPESTANNSTFMQENNETEMAKKGEDTKESDLEGNLVIRSKGDLSLERNIELFLQKYPNVCIENIISGSSNDYPLVEANSLMSGEDIDIIELSGYSLFKFIEQGYLEELSSKMEKDEDFFCSSFFDNIFEAINYNNKIYTISDGYNIPFCYINKKITDALNIDLNEYQFLTTYQLIDIYNQAINKKIIDSDYPFSYNRDKTMFFNIEYHRFIDVENKKAYFETEDFVEYLNLMDSITTDITISERPTFTTIEDESRPSDEMQYFVKIFGYIGDSNFENANEETD